MKLYIYITESPEQNTPSSFQLLGLEILLMYKWKQELSCITSVNNLRGLALDFTPKAHCAVIPSVYTCTFLTPPTCTDWSRRNGPSSLDKPSVRIKAWVLPSQETLGEVGELAFPVLYEVSLGHEVVKLLPLLWDHHPCILFHAEPQTCTAEKIQKAYEYYDFNNNLWFQFWNPGPEM